MWRPNGLSHVARPPATSRNGNRLDTVVGGVARQVRLRAPLLLAGVLVVCLVAVSGTAARPAADVTTGASATDAGTTGTSDGTGEETLSRRFTLSLTPDVPGEVGVDLRFRIPDDVTTLTVRLPEDATVESTEGFRRRSGNTFDWDRSTDTPSITYDVPVNRTITRGREGEETGGYIYVDTGDWAIVRAPRAGVTYSGTGSKPRLETGYEFAGSGATTGDVAYLGDHREYTRRAGGQQFRLVVPAAADMRESPEAVLQSLARGAETLSVGERDPVVLGIAAPATVEWGSTGLQRGESDFWVLADRRVDTPNNIWLHEYVHTRQAYRPTEETRWTVEGMADYYAAHLTYRQGRIDYDRYRRHLAQGERHDDVVLTDPETWERTLAPYDKGALVFAALDRQIRQRTDGNATLQGVVRQLNNGTATHDEFLSAVESTGGAETREDAREFTETTAVPETWSRQAHREAFGSDRPSFGYEFDPPYDRTGPFRSDRVGASPTVVVNETLRIRVAVENTGGGTGDYRAVLRADGDRVATKTGTLDPGQRTVVTFRKRFTEPGSVRLTVGGASESVTVRRPAGLVVTRLQAPRRTAPGERVALRATVASAADRPAKGTVTLAADGRTLESRDLTLDATETATVTARTSFDVGDHAVTAGNRERTLRVREEFTPTTPTGGETVTPVDPSETPTGDLGPGHGQSDTPTATQPGFGALAVVAAILALVASLFHRR